MHSTIRELLAAAEQDFGAQDAFRYKVKDSGNGKKEVRIEAKTYTQLKEDSECFSAVLAELGQQGKHIAIVGPTSYSWVVAYFGTADSGSVVVPLDANLPEADLCELIDRADVTTLVYDEAKAGVAQMAAQRCTKLEHILCMSEPHGIAKEQSMWELIGGQHAGFDYAPQPDQLATIMFTSGTTGKSKGVMLTHRNLAENATCLDMGLESGIVILSVLPIHHAYCLSMDIQLFEPNMILMVPLMIETLAKKLEEAAWIPAPLVKAKVFGKQFHTVCSGGAYLNPAYLEMFQKYGITIWQGYGMTECSPVISTNYGDFMKDGSVGRLMPNCEAKVVDEEIWVKGSSVMQGYYNMPQETAETLADGWLKTGDLGYVDEDGYLFLTGRKKNLIITPNGENVSPEEIENKLGENRLVQEVLVRESEGVIEAEIFPDHEYAGKKKIKDVQGELQKIIDAYNQGAPLYKRVFRLKVRETEFEKNTTKKIKRF